MKKKHSSNRAILVLEAPWELDAADSNRTSVMPFVDGVAKYSGDTEVYHANFYDKSSFEKAISCLCKTKFSNTIIYIAAHGYKKEIGNMKLMDALLLIGKKSREYNITGVMLGSCFVGGNNTTLEVCLEGTNLKWCAGYSSSSYWLGGTMIDCSILAHMSQLDPDDFYERDVIIATLGRAISQFSGSYQIGTDYREAPVSLENSLQFVVQISGQGQRAKTVSSEVLALQKHYQRVAGGGNRLVFS